MLCLRRAAQAGQVSFVSIGVPQNLSGFARCVEPLFPGRVTFRVGIAVALGRYKVRVIGDPFALGVRTNFAAGGAEVHTSARAVSLLVKSVGQGIV